MTKEELADRLPGAFPDELAFPLDTPESFPAAAGFRRGRSPDLRR